MLQTMIKQRRDSIGLYEKGGRPELAQQEAEGPSVVYKDPIDPRQNRTAAGLDSG